MELLGGGGGPFHETRETIHGGASAPFKILVKFQKWRPSPLAKLSVVPFGAGKLESPHISPTVAGYRFNFAAIPLSFNRLFLHESY